MTSASPIGLERLRSQRISTSILTTPADLVGHFGAMQGQDYLASLHAIGLRCGITSEAQVEAAVEDRSIVRTWPLRGTLHFVAAADYRWMMSLLAPRSLASQARGFAALEIDDVVARKSQKLFARALAGGQQLPRQRLYAALEDGGIATAKQRGYYLLWRAAQEQVICWGTRIGKEHRFALVDDWVPEAAALSREESIVRLATRYFTSHGPATLADFVWWSGLVTAEAKRSIELSGSALSWERIGENVYWRAAGSDRENSGHAPAGPKFPASQLRLLPAFDEYIVAYRNRGDVLDPVFAKVINAGGGMLKPVLVIGGTVAGIWKKLQQKGSVKISVRPFLELTSSEREVLQLEAERVAGFVGCRLDLAVAPHHI